MGVCCSKKATVGVTEVKQVNKTKQGLLITENVGKTESPHISVEHSTLPDHLNGLQNTSDELKIERKPSPQNARSTLIFPSYTGYKNPGSFGGSISPKRTHPLDNPPTAFVTPFQTQISSPHTQRAAVDFVARRTSPLLSRYSPHPSPNLPRRTLPSPFLAHTSTRFAGASSDNFDSDLDTTDDEEIPNQVQPINILRAPEIVKKAPKNDVVLTIPKQKNLKSDYLGLKPIAKNEQEVQTTPPNNKTTFNSGVQADAQIKSSNQQTDNVHTIQMVDASVGTDNDNFYRSTQTTTINNKKNSKKQFATTATETTPDLKNKKVQNTSVSMGTNTTNLTIIVIDKCIGTDNDEIFELKREIQTQTKPKKKKKTHTISTSTQNSPLLKPRNIPAPPKIVKEKSDLKPKPIKQSRSPSPVPPTSSSGPEIIPKSDPIIETLENAFYRFARYGEINSDGKEMNNKNWAKLCRDCFFIDNKTVLVGDVDVIFSRHKRKGYRLIDFEMFINCLNEVADRKYEKKFPDTRTRREIVYNGVIGKAPELIGITGVSTTGNVGRMTDHTLYPVSHKIRFDEEGRGLGIEEKFEYDDTHMGYVNGYKERDTYDLKLQGSPNLKLTPRRPVSSLSVSRPLSSSSQRS